MAGNFNFEGKMIYLVYLVEGKEVQIMKIIITREYHYNSLIGKKRNQIMVWI